MKQSELQIVLDKHLKWVHDEEGGNWADLTKANLRGANLTGANLRGANCSGGNLSWA